MEAPIDDAEFREIELFLESFELLRTRTPLIQTQVQAETGFRVGFPVLPTRYRGTPLNPDELMIQQRGRKRLPVTWSPDVDLKRLSACQRTAQSSKTPSKDSSPIKTTVTQRSAPRKRLFALTPEKTEFSDPPTPEKFKITSLSKSAPPLKRPKIERNLSDELDT